MAQQLDTQLIPKEAQIQLAIQALEKDQIYGLRNAAHIFNIPFSTLQERRAGTASRRDIKPNSINLTVTKEAAIIQWILKLNSRGFAPQLNTVQEIANKLLAERGQDLIGIN